jgi:hypothetical protein
MAEQHMHHLQQHASAAHGSDVLCPVCKGCHLVQRAGLLVCPAEGWRLNLAAESLSLDDIRARLAAAYQVRLCLCGFGGGLTGCYCPWVKACCPHPLPSWCMPQP